MTSCLKQATVQEKAKQNPLSKCRIITELSMDKIHLQIMLSDIGYSSFKILVVFCTEKEQEDLD
jgi:hypothetical protein